MLVGYFAVVISFLRDCGGVKPTDSAWRELVEFRQPDTDGGVDTDHPGGVQEVVDKCQEDGQFCDGDRGT